MVKVFDCCMFWSELDMLEARLHILEDVVDYFVICEAAQTHSGAPKPYHLALNRARFERWADKIIYVTVPDLTGAGRNSWERERYHRSRIADGLMEAAPDDWIVIGDCDEIPSPEAINELRRAASLNRVKFELAMYYYNLNWRVNQGWAIGAYRHAVESDPNRIRACADGLAVPLMPPGKVNAGWHFSYFGGAEQIIAKVDSFMHHQDPIIGDMPRDVAYVEDKVRAGRDLFNRDDMQMVHVPLLDGLPRYILDNVEKYRAMGWVNE